MLNFEYCNPARIVFGKGAIAKLGGLIPKGQRIMMAYGGGSIKRNGVYDQVKAALADRDIVEFGGIEPNPQYATLCRAVEIVRAEKAGFILAVGGGSVLDGVKFIAAAAPYEAVDLWEMVLSHGAQVQSAVPLGSVLTLPATGSEMNKNAVISRAETGEKQAIYSDFVIPRFSILDPETTFSLPERQTANGVVDAYVHVMEQYMTYPVNSPLQDRQAEAILLTLIEEGPKALTDPKDYEVRANLMWSATHALNGLLGCGVPGDWATHMIGHELTARFGLDHARTLAIVMPSLLRYQSGKKAAKLLQYGERVWGINEGADDERIAAAIDKTEDFFRSMGMKTKLSECDAATGWEEIPAKFETRLLGEYQDIGPAEVKAILEKSV